MRSAPIHVVVHYPKTQEGQRELAQRIAAVHADVVKDYIKGLACPTEQKKSLAEKVKTQVTQQI